MIRVFEAARLIASKNLTVLDVRRFEDRQFREYCTPIVKRVCSSCLGTLNSSKMKCQGEGCELKDVVCEKGTNSEQTVIYSFSIRKQLERVLKNQIKEIIETHQYHHDLKANNLEHDDLSSVHKSRRYSENIESTAEFQEGILKLPVSLAYDGFRPSNLSKDEVTPLYLRVEGIRKIRKETEESVILCAVHSGPKGVSHKNADLFGNRLRNEVADIRNDNIIIFFDNKQWNIEIVVIMAMLDLKGSRLVSGYPNWYDISGCAHCTIRGVRVGTASVSFVCGSSTHPRSREEVRRLLEENSKLNSLSLLVNPKDHPIDELHVVAEGLYKRILFDIVGKSDFWKELKVSPRVVKELDSSLALIKSHAGFRTQFGRLTKLGRMSGSQLKQTTRIVIILLAATDVYQDVSLKMFLLCIVAYVDICYTIQSVHDIPSLKNIGEVLKMYIRRLHSDNCNYKSHLLIDHSVENILAYGNFSGTSTAPFEKCHRLISIGYNQYATSVNNMCKKFEIGNRKKSEVSQPRLSASRKFIENL
uniref:DUF4806 domain-containing protein n=1 Tax=Caenorhabditis tropicalis TaxID=1561998 RepID=A0A1I7UHT9_9PELO